MFQRIDDDREIDMSFVTCAEYQLFLDEMQAQGEYHQPDHWMDFRFPSGQAKAPITGVRYKNAEAFCLWLNRSRGEKYRLSTEDEMQAFPIEPSIPLATWGQNRELIGLSHEIREVEKITFPFC